MRATIDNNLRCLEEILHYNMSHGIMFFRISSDLIPFASHPVCRFNWQQYFRGRFEVLGRYIQASQMRVSMHPDQFNVLNSLDRRIVDRSVRELAYQAQVLDLMAVGLDAKVQIHVGGAYGNKLEAIKRFVDCYRRLPVDIRRRLVIENDDRIYTLEECLGISRKTGVPVVFDVFHHDLNGNGKSYQECVRQVCRTWKKRDGPAILDYSSQEPGARRGSHAVSIDESDFRKFLTRIHGTDCDIMLEIKDKEKSAVQALAMVKGRRPLPRGLVLIGKEQQ
jgi:UV DNA damage endonuclease